MRKFYLLTALALAFVLFAALVGGAQAQTTIGSGVDLPRQASITFMSPTVITATYNSPAIDLSAYNVLEMQYVIDVATVNTSTGILQGSMDGTNWVTTGSIFAAVVADANTMVTPTAALKWSRINVTVANTNPFTVAVYAVSQ